MKKLLFISKKTPADMLEKLAGKYEIRPLEPSRLLAEPVAAHADMLAAPLFSKLIVCRYYYEENARLFDGAPVVLTDEAHKKEYPGDVLLNCFELGGKVYGRKDSAAKYITDNAAGFVGVKQGYAHCSTLLCDSCAVTADVGIFRALTENGVDALKISPGYIELPGCSCGFIGGASFFDEGTACFFGSLSYHPDGKRIKAFLSDHKIGTVELSDGGLLDLGGAAALSVP